MHGLDMLGNKEKWFRSGRVRAVEVSSTAEASLGGSNSFFARRGGAKTMGRGRLPSPVPELAHEIRIPISPAKRWSPAEMTPPREPAQPSVNEGCNENGYVAT